MTLSKAEQKKKEFRLKENARKRAWRLRKKEERERLKMRPERISSPQASPKRKPVRSAMRQRYALEEKGKQLIEELKTDIEDGAGPPRRPNGPRNFTAPQKAPLIPRIRIRKKARKVFSEIVPEAKEPQDLEVTEEQIEKPQTTKHCPESVKEDGLREVRRDPEYYIEINMVTKSRVVDTFFIPSERKVFHYKTKEYNVDEDTIYLLPTKIGLFMPTCHYKEGTVQPQGFRQTNRGITGKALSLLYMEQLYTSLLYSEDLKYNFFIVVLSIAILIAYGIGLYFLFFNNGGLLPQSIPAPSALGLMSPLGGFL